MRSAALNSCSNLVIIFILTLFIFTSLFASSPRFPSSNIGSATPSSNVSYDALLVWALPALVLYAYDEPLTKAYETQWVPQLKYHSGGLLAINRDYAMFQTLKFLFVVQEGAKNKPLQRFVYLASDAFIEANIISQSLKQVVGRARPTAGQGAYSWGHSNTDLQGPYTSFPSTHATTYFAVSTILGKSIKNEFLGDIFGALNFFVMREDHWHWMSDMWVGYGLGKWIGNLVWERRKNENFDNAWLIYPTFQHQNDAYPSIGFWKIIR